MELILPADIQQFIESEVARGRYDTPQAALVNGVRFLMRLEKSQSEWSAEIHDCAEEIERGLFREYGRDELDRLIDDVEAEIASIDGPSSGDSES